MMILDAWRRLPWRVDEVGHVSVLASIPIAVMRPREKRESADAQARVARYAAAMRRGAHFPPVELFGPRWPGDTYQVIDGHHRRLAAVRAGYTRLLAWVTPVHRRPGDPPAWWASVRVEDIDPEQFGPRWGESYRTSSSSEHREFLTHLLLRHAACPTEVTWHGVLRGVLWVAQREGGLHPGWAEEMVWAGVTIPRALPVGLRSDAQEAVLRPGFRFRAVMDEGGGLAWAGPDGEVWAPLAPGGEGPRGRHWWDGKEHARFDRHRGAPVIA